jgi:hypothetical protein
MRLFKALKDIGADLLLGYAPAFYTAGLITYGLDYVSQVLVVLMLTVAYVLRAPQVTDQNYVAFLAGYFTAAAGGLA